MPQNEHSDIERRDVDDTMPVPRFNQEAARQARQVMLLPAAAGAQLRRRFKTHRFLPVTFIAGAAIIGAVTGSILWRYRQTRAAAPTQVAVATRPQPNQLASVPQRESVAPKTPPSSVINSNSSIVGAVINAPADEVKLRRISGGVPAPRPVAVNVASPGEASRRATSHSVAQVKPRQQEARSRRPAESVAAVGAVRRRTTEPASKEKQTHENEQKSQHREKNERHETPLPPLPQDAGAIGRVRDVFEGQPEKRTTADRNVDRVTAIFTGRRRQ